MRLSVSFQAVALCLTSLGCARDPAADDDFPRGVDASSQAIRAVARSNDAVAAKLNRALSSQPGNVFYSPLSVEAVSGMLLAAAAGETAAQLGALLDAEDDHAALHEGIGALLKDLNGERDTYALSVANRLWTIPGLAPHQTFLDTMRNNYGAPTASVDFARAPNAALAEINDWVSGQTKGKISNLLQPGDITASTLIAVVNAIYFKADWATSFDPALTRVDTFHRADGKDVSVKMMTSDGIYRSKSDADGSWLELPYRTGELSFLAHASASSGPAQLQADLADVDLDEVRQSLHESRTVVQMPRFSMRSRLNLVPVFEQLGVTDLFDSMRADLSNVGANGDVYVDPLVHEAAVWVDEQGTTAVGATAGGAQVVSSPPLLRFDRPFVFVTRDNRTHTSLFVGRVEDPSVGLDD